MNSKTYSSVSILRAKPGSMLGKLVQQCSLLPVVIEIKIYSDFYEVIYLYHLSLPLWFYISYTGLCFPNGK